MSDLDRRNFLGGGMALAAAAGVGVAKTAAGDGTGLAFGNRAHFFAPRDVKEKLIWCFRDVIGCGTPMILEAPGVAEPIVAFRFPGGGS